MEYIRELVMVCWLFFMPSETPGCHYHADGMEHCEGHTLDLSKIK